MRLPLCLALIVLGAYCASYDETFLRQLNKNEFGQTILATLQVEMQQGGDSAERIVTLLRQMRADLQVESESSDSKNDDQEALCVVKLQETQDSITKSQEQKASDESQLPLMIEEQSDKQRQFVDKGEQEQRNNDRIVLNTIERDVTRGGYEERRDELTAYVGALQEAKRILAQGNSFLQIPEKTLLELKQHQTRFTKTHSKQGGYHGLVSLLLEFTLEQDNGSNKVLAIIDELVESIYELQLQELKIDNQRQQDYETLKYQLKLKIKRARIVQETARLEFTIADLQAKVLHIGQLLLELQNDIRFNQQFIENQTFQNQDWQKTCNDQSRAYELLTINSNEQSQILDQCILIFETKFDNVEAFLQTIKN